MASEAHRAIDAVWRIESPLLIAGLTQIVRDVGLAEELAQDALVVALEKWPESGVPDNPGAWLMATAQHRAIDHVRRNKLLDRKHEELGRELEARLSSVLEVIYLVFNEGYSTTSGEPRTTTPPTHRNEAHILKLVKTIDRSNSVASAATRKRGRAAFPALGLSHFFTRKLETRGEATSDKHCTRFTASLATPRLRQGASPE